jgi:hypothetical protein
VGLRRVAIAQHAHVLAGVFAVALILTSYLAALRLAPVNAQITDEGPGAQAELALAVAKVAANEASLSAIRPAEVALVWQTTEARASSTARRLAWLRVHSSCVLTDREMTAAERRGNCVWSRHLTDRDVKPDNFPEHLSWPTHARRWAQVRAYAHRLVDGRERFRPCVGAPFTWGGEMDHAAALERGLVPLRCVDREGEPTLNTGYALARARGAS